MSSSSSSSAAASSATINIGIVGAGLNGALLAALLGKLGFTVTLFEKREDPRVSRGEDVPLRGIHEVDAILSAAAPTRRTINLALSHRGIIGLEEIGVIDEVMKGAIKMTRRSIHMSDGGIAYQQYGLNDAGIFSVSRANLNNTLLNKIETMPNVTLHFSHSIISANKNGELVFQSLEGAIKTYNFDFVVAADGAYSVTRDCVLRSGRIDFQRKYVPHGYKELNIPPVRNEQGELVHALTPVNSLHVWPRGEFMMLALPNPDKTFTATLFAPFVSKEGDGGFDSLDPNNEEAVLAHFRKYFPDVVPLMPDLVKDYKNNPIGSLVSMKVNPWNSGRLVLIGDAAHAVVPFYGQGMNCGFEDCMVMYELFKSKLAQSAPINLPQLAAEFSALRIPPTSALSDLCVEHYHDLASNTSSNLYLARKIVESILQRIIPNFTPLYTLISFTSTPYHEAVAQAHRQDRFVDLLFSGVGLGLVAAGLFGWTKFSGQKLW